MRIANPIYDCVFKFLMQDKAAAKVIIGAITEFDVEDLELRPTEVQTSAGSIKDLTVYRLDLAARIKTPEGSKLVTIEIQKAKDVTDIMRFRRYLGSQYSSKHNYEQVSVVCEDSKADYGAMRALPIFTIYILGYALKTYPDISVIKVKRKYYDNVTKQELHKKDEFIESLTHDSAIIQVPALSGRRRDRLEKVLSIFDQTRATQDDLHTLLYTDEPNLPKEVKLLLRRLQLAFSTEEVRQQMTLEDEILYELKHRQQRIMQLQDSLDNESKLRQTAEQKAEIERAEKEAAQQKAEIERAEKEAAEQQAQIERAEKEAAQQKAEVERAEKEAAQQKAEAAEQKAEVERAEKEKLLAELELLKKKLSQIQE